MSFNQTPQGALGPLTGLPTNVTPDVTSLTGALTTLGQNLYSWSFRVAGFLNNEGLYQSAIVLLGSAVSLTNNIPASITSLTLTGDWEVWGEAWFSGSSATATLAVGSISTTSASIATVPADNSVTIKDSWTGTPPILQVPLTPIQALGAVATTYYLNLQASFTAGSVVGYGILRARRWK